MKPLNIILWADLQCPFCYTAETCLNRAIETLGVSDKVRIDLKSREIHRPEDGNGDQPMIQIFQDKEGFTPEGAKAHIADINAMLHDEAKIACADFGKVHESNDHDALRLCKLARDLGCEKELREALHTAYFCQGKKLADVQTLKDAGKEAGIKEELIDRLLAEGWYENEVLNDETEFHALKLDSVPYLIMDQEVFPDHLDTEGYIEALKRHLRD